MNKKRNFAKMALLSALLCGLASPTFIGCKDYDDDIAPAPHDVQIDCMARQLEVAVRRNVPVELHLRHEDTDEERTSHVDAYNVLREVGVPQAGCVLHCFGEDRATMERFVDLGCYIAYGGAAQYIAYALPVAVERLSAFRLSQRK